MLARDGILREEARLLLFQELAEPRLHFSVLRSLAGGDTRVSEVANRTGLDTSTVSRVLDTLLSLMLVRRVVPITATLRGRTKRTAWEISDPYMRFWFRFVLPFEERLRRVDDQVRHLEETVMPALDEFVSRPVFERIAQAYVRDRFGLADVGTWWGKVPTGYGRATETREVDVVGRNPDGSVAVLGSCKWSPSLMSGAEDDLLTRLEPYVLQHEDAGRPVRAFFSRSGFDDALVRLERIGLIASEIDEQGRRQISMTGTHPLVDPLAGLIAAESRAAYAPAQGSPSRTSALLERINPRVRGLVPGILETSRAYGATRVALFGSSTQVDPAVVPGDLDVSVRFDPDDPRSRGDLYFGLKAALERLTGMRVDLVEGEAIDNPYLLAELADSEEVLYEAS